MGTSGSSRGPANGTPLVPTWLDEPASGPLPGGAPDTAPPADGAGDDGGGDDGNSKPAGDGNTDAARPVIPAPPSPGRYQSARRNFSTFAGSGGNDRRALRRAVRDYVRSGAGGS